MMKQARRLQDNPPFPFAGWGKHVAAAFRQGLDVIRLDIGNPDLPPPDEVIEALCHSARQPEHHGYPGYRGIRTLREAVAAYYQRRFGVTLDPDREIIPLIGSKEGIANLALACLDAGDLVLVPDPGYAAYTLGANLAGATVHTMSLRAENNFLPDLIVPPDVAERAVLMWLNYPNNPTGATADLGFFARAVDFARRHGLLLCHDAPYCDVTYDGYAAPSVLQVSGASEVAIEFNSLSKTWNMAGWRIGIAVGNAEALRALAQLKSNVDSGIFRPVQEAAARALSVDPGWVAARNAIYRERMDIVLDGLDAMGIVHHRPRATLYVWAQTPPGWASEPFARAVLEQAGIALAPGSFFGPAGEGFVRLSVTAPTPRIREAMARLGQCVPAL